MFTKATQYLRHSDYHKRGSPKGSLEKSASKQDAVRYGPLSSLASPVPIISPTSAETQMSFCSAILGARGSRSAIALCHRTSSRTAEELIRFDSFDLDYYDFKNGHTVHFALLIPFRDSLGLYGSLFVCMF